MSPTFRLVSVCHRLLVNPGTLQPRRGILLLFHYGVGGGAVFIVGTMALLGLEAYGLRFAGDFLYARLGESVLQTLESFLF